MMLSAFVNVTSTSGLGNEARNFAVGDYDNDGLDDVAFISFGYTETRALPQLGRHAVLPMWSASAGVYGTYSWRSSWVDYDDDGLLDLYLCGTASYLFRNLGNGTFEELAASAGMQVGGRSQRPAGLRQGRRRRPLRGPHQHEPAVPEQRQRNLRVQSAQPAGVSDPSGTSGVCAGDYDGDGFFDLCTA
ncbi:MAG: hypothetical protein MZV70_33600 [Desulfobacterales bacterium]|nr:hypothetical protein [Desulfobacterales bacterium]